MTDFEAELVKDNERATRNEILRNVLKHYSLNGNGQPKNPTEIVSNCKMFEGFVKGG